MLLLPSYRSDSFSDPNLLVRDEYCRARVESVDNEDVQDFGVVSSGEQRLLITVKNGVYHGLATNVVNHLNGMLERDVVYKKGDIVLAHIQSVKNNILFVRVIDHYRLRAEIILMLIFAVFLIFFGGHTGYRSLLSFLMAALMIWKILLPGFLKDYPPLLFSLAFCILLTALIIFMVGGLNLKGLTAFLGALSGIVFTCIISVVFAHFFKINGTVKQYSATLLHSGYQHLDISGIFLAGIFLASSGAVMDLSMDISAGMFELKLKKGEMGRLELLLSGFSIARPVIGTMTTTLLLAYSGLFTTLLMIFISRGTPIEYVLNFKMISAEILHTIVGSFGLVMVGPFTAVIGSAILSHSSQDK